MIFLGVDIGFDRCGYCVLDYDQVLGKSSIVSAGLIVSDKGLRIEERLGVIYEDLCEIRDRFRPDYVSIEKLFFHRKNMTFEKVCMSKGVAMVVFRGCEVLEVEPKRMKKHVVGNGNAKKEEIRFLTEKILGVNLGGVYDDTVDAICLGLYHIDFVKIQGMLVKESREV